MYFDTHVHLNDARLFSNIETHLSNAISNNISYMICVGYDVASSLLAVEIANRYSNVYAAVGIGPNDSADVTDEDLRKIDELMSDPKVVALGEIGLDYHYDYCPKEKQIEVFQAQIKIAKNYNKPLVIHSRDALQDTFDYLEAGQHFGVMHCYSGSYEMAERFISIGYYISLAGPVTFANAKTPKEVAMKIDLEKLLIETDCPYLTPHPYRGKLNEPANVVYVAQEIARLRNLDVNEVAQHTTFNAKKVFGIK